MTLSERQRKPNDPNLPPENERSLRACSDIVSFLVQDHEAQQDLSAPRKDVNLNSLRAKMSKKHRLSNMPPLTAIIAAIPEHYKKYILPKLIAKPIRKYLPRLLHQLLTNPRKCIRYCCRRCDVQTPQMSSHCLHWQYLCLLSRWTRLRFRILDTVIHWL